MYVIIMPGHIIPTLKCRVKCRVPKQNSVAENCMELHRIVQNCAENCMELHRIVKNCSELCRIALNYRAQNSLQVKSTCLGNPS